MSPRAYIACLPALVPLAGFYFWGGTRAGFSTKIDAGSHPRRSPAKNSQGMFGDLT
jgi:hypothetical protein